MRPTSFVTKLLTILAWSLLSPSSWAGDASVTDGCRGDLNYLPGFLLANDTGAADNRRYRGEAVIAAAYNAADRSVAAVKSESDCLAVISTYLKAWREKHLAIVPADWSPVDDAKSSAENTSSAAASQARIHWLSNKTVVLTFPTFYATAVEAIATTMTHNQRRLARTPNWIIDVRNNDGGDDGTYAPIADAVIGNPILMAGVEFLSTPANIGGTAGICDLYAPGDARCAAEVGSLVTLMRAAKPGTYVPHTRLGNIVTKVDPSESRRRRPARVAVLTDQGCGSSCEQFVLEMKQAWNVKIFGRRTAGALDYSNLRPHKLPSGRRIVLYATSRSKRLPYMPVDAVGIAPDVFLPPPVDEAARAIEIDTVRALMEQR